MSERLEVAAVVELLRRKPAAWQALTRAIREAGSALAVLNASEGLLAGSALEHTLGQIASWERQQLQLITVLDPSYPANLRAVHDHPPLLFLAGTMLEDDERSVAVIGSRSASRAGLRAASSLAEALVHERFTVVSGLAAGVDTAAHAAALAAGGRSVAVLPSGLRRCYPPQNRALQARLAEHGCVISRFWPEEPPSRTSFQLRNALMSGVSLASVIVEAGERSGCRTQARAALAHGRPVFVRRPVLGQAWARELAKRPGVYVYDEPEGLLATIKQLTALTPLSC